MLLNIIAFIVGICLGLVYSYSKYKAPYVEKRIDKLALVSAIIGGLIFNLSPPIGSLFLGFPLGMRPGYGRMEFLVGVVIAVLIYLI
jgi:energy-converting hydrogenase A subunit L